MRLLILSVLALSLAACATTKPDVPRGVIVVPKAVPVVRTVYVNVPADLTDQMPIAGAFSGVGHEPPAGGVFK